MEIAQETNDNDEFKPELDCEYNPLEDSKNPITGKFD